MRSADELWMTSTTKGVLPVVTVDGRPVGTGRHRLSRRGLCANGEFVAAVQNRVHADALYRELSGHPMVKVVL
jgi:branched-subunit amino acid aminotransferase/4-amino-4-deoxychorismate lyase